LARWLQAGELSPGIYGAITRELNNRLPTAESFILPGASHVLQMENPADFGNAVLQFLSKTTDMVREKTNARGSL
jgi:pimeloyl-ACP methyl ester carboxylesterase